jgi:hypothetical protein
MAAARTGELLHVPADLRCASTAVVEYAPRRLLTLRELDERAAASQTADAAAPAAAPDPHRRTNP